MKPYVAASSYLNTAPLCYSFIYGEQRNRCEFLSDAAPAVCSDMLKTRRADAAMIPAIEYQRIDGLLAVPNVCVGNRQKKIRLKYLCCFQKSGSQRCSGIACAD